MNRDVEMLTLLLLDPFLTVDEASREAAAMPRSVWMSESRLRNAVPEEAAEEVLVEGTEIVA